MPPRSATHALECSPVVARQSIDAAKKARQSGQAAAMLRSSPRGKGKDLTAPSVRLAPRSRIPEPAPQVGGDVPPGMARPLVTPMNEVTRILSGIEAGDPHAAEQLLPLVYDELRKLAA